MIPIQPKHAILIGFCMTLLGVILPFLMVMRVIESTLLLNFIAFTVPIAGLFLGIIGAASLTRRQ